MKTSTGNFPGGTRIQRFATLLVSAAAWGALGAGVLTTLTSPASADEKSPLNTATIIVPRPGQELASSDRPSGLIAVPTNTGGRAAGQPAVSSLPPAPLAGPRPRTLPPGVIARSDYVRRTGDDRISFTIVHPPRGPFGVPWLNHGMPGQHTGGDVEQIPGAAPTITPAGTR
ncbi:MAG: hypothetical protein ACK5WB_11770 [Phycisphaerales bacterium]|jgi:hypothetical protein|nr:hypothetical protein [Phycisphaeraceae bacterium]